VTTRRATTLRDQSDAHATASATNLAAAAQSGSGRICHLRSDHLDAVAPPVGPTVEAGPPAQAVYQEGLLYPFCRPHALAGAEDGPDRGGGSRRCPAAPPAQSAHAARLPSARRRSACRRLRPAGAAWSRTRPSCVLALQRSLHPQYSCPGARQPSVDGHG